jgi:HAD superfamily hydrolase (TIGR01509 family)
VIAGSPTARRRDVTASPGRCASVSARHTYGSAQPNASDHSLWIFDFDNTLAPLEPAVDWAKSRRELQAWLGAQGVAQALFEEFPRGTLVLYETLRARLCAGGDAARAVLARGEIAAALGSGNNGAPGRGGGRVAAAALRALLGGASEIIECHELARVRAVAPAPGAIELLRALRAAGGSIAIVTSNSSRTVAAWLRARHAENLVDLIVGRDSGLALKPSPAMVQRALEAFAVAPADAAFAGDSDADLKAAAAAAVRFYGVNATVAGRERLVALGASRVFSSPSELSIYLHLSIGREAAPLSLFFDYFARSFNTLCLRVLKRSV